MPEGYMQEVKRAHTGVAGKLVAERLGLSIHCRGIRCGQLKGAVSKVLPERCPSGGSLRLGDGLTKHRQPECVAEFQRHQRGDREGFSHGLHERRSRCRGCLLEVQGQEETRVRVILHLSPRFESRMAAEASGESTFSPKVCFSRVR